MLSKRNSLLVSKLTPTSSHSSSASLAATARPAMATAAVLEPRSGPTGAGTGVTGPSSSRGRGGGAEHGGW